MVHSGDECDRCADAAIDKSHLWESTYDREYAPLWDTPCWEHFVRSQQIFTDYLRIRTVNRYHCIRCSILILPYFSKSCVPPNLSLTDFWKILWTIVFSMRISCRWTTTATHALLTRWCTLCRIAGCMLESTGLAAIGKLCYCW
jgi:hypothetical protein